MTRSADIFMLTSEVGVSEELAPGDPPRIGPYRIIRRLGSGGLGQVFLRRSAGGRPVAVKVIRADLAADPGCRARFRRDVDAARKVTGLYTALLADLDGPLPWLATAYVAGSSLAAAVAATGRCRPPWSSCWPQGWREPGLDPLRRRGAS
jgi:eukaryotic-like serine/threonine-protein kinase